MDAFAAQLGRLHPVLVHLPIGFLVLLVGLELGDWISRRRRPNALPLIGRATRTFVLVLAAVASITTAACGWLLAYSGDYTGPLVSRHAFFGFAVAGLALALLAVHVLAWHRLYGVFLALLPVIVLVAGHLGGSLTHGSDYLAGLLPASLHRFIVGEEPSAPVSMRAAADALVFADAVQPILTQRCGSCHGPNKSNGDLRLDSWAALQRGGKNGTVCRAGDAAKSPLVQRIVLPLDAKEHMPPKGKPQLTDGEIALLEWWVASGASDQARIATAVPPPAVEDTLAAIYPDLNPPPLDRATTLAAAEKIAKQLNLVIHPLSPKEPWLDVSARLQFAKFGDAELAQLEPISPAIQWLDIGETAITDVGLAALRTMPQLRRLHLDRTKISDAGLASLAPLSRLEYLNLFGTDVSDLGIAALRPLLRLRSLYVWQTRVTPVALHALSEQLVDQRAIRRWHGDIAELQRRIVAEQFTANVGETLPTLQMPPAPLAKENP